MKDGCLTDSFSDPSLQSSDGHPTNYFLFHFIFIVY